MNKSTIPHPFRVICKHTKKVLLTSRRAKPAQVWAVTRVYGTHRLISRDPDRYVQRTPADVWVVDNDGNEVRP